MDLSETITKISAYETIETVEEKFETFNHRRNGDQVTHETRSLGWYIRCAGSSSLYVGKHKPPAAFKRGARVKLSVELTAAIHVGFAPTLPPDPLKPLAAALSVPEKTD